MSPPDLDSAWKELITSQESCQLCRTSRTPALVEAGARPLFGRFKPWTNGVLFVFEAPNWDDTFDPNKGYLTYDRETDPTGRFTRSLLIEELGLNPDYFQVTNSVLCLPARKNGKFPVGATQRKLCVPRIREQIQVLDPAVVVPVGGKALEATRSMDDHPYTNMHDAVTRPVRWWDRWLFPLYHTGMQARYGPGGRKPAEQHQDWRDLRGFLKQQGIAIPPCTP